MCCSSQIRGALTAAESSVQGINSLLWSGFKIICSGYNFHNFISYLFPVVLVSSDGEQFGAVPDKIYSKATLCFSVHIQRVGYFCHPCLMRTEGYGCCRCKSWRFKDCRIEKGTWFLNHLSLLTEFWLTEVKLISFWFWFTSVFPWRIRNPVLDRSAVNDTARKVLKRSAEGN